MDRVHAKYEKDARRILVWKVLGKTSFMIYKPKCEFNVKWILERENANWIQMAENRDLWRSLLNRVINLRVPEKTGDFLTSNYQLFNNKFPYPHKFIQNTSRVLDESMYVPPAIQICLRIHIL